MINITKTELKDIYLGAVEKDGGWDVKVYLINTSDKPKILHLLQGSFQGDEDGLLDLGHSPYKEIIIPAQGYVQIDHMDDAGQLDFTTYYNIKFEDNEYIEQINGWSFSEDKLVDIPILNERGYFSGFGKVGKRVEDTLKLRDKGQSIDEVTSHLLKNNLMKKLFEKLNNLSLPAVILIASLILGGFILATQIIKQQSIERQQDIKLQEDRRAEEAKAEQEQKEYVAKRKGDCYEIYEKERDQWNNVEGNFYNEERDVCTIIYEKDSEKIYNIKECIDRGLGVGVGPAYCETEKTTFIKEF